MGLSEVGRPKDVKVDTIKDCLVKLENCGVNLVKCSVKVDRLPTRKSLLVKERKDKSRWHVRQPELGVKEPQANPLYSCSITYSTKNIPVAGRTREKWFYPRHRVFSSDNCQNNLVSSSSHPKKFSSLGTLQRLKLIQDKAISSSQKSKSVCKAIQALKSQMAQNSSMIKMRVEYLKSKENTKNLRVFSVPRKVAVKFVITASRNCARDVGRALISGEGLHYPKVDEVDLVEYEQSDVEKDDSDAFERVFKNFSEVSDEFYSEDWLKDPVDCPQVWQTQGSEVHNEIVARSKSNINKI